MCKKNTGPNACNCGVGAKGCKGKYSKDDLNNGAYVEYQTDSGSRAVYFFMDGALKPFNHTNHQPVPFEEIESGRIVSMYKNPHNM